MVATLKGFKFRQVVDAMEKVEQRLHRSTAALEAAGIKYAVVGGNAVAAWVSSVDKSLVRNTRDVDILLRRDDLPAAKIALEAIGFVYRHVAGIDVFLDSPDAKAGDGVHIVFAGEKVRADEPVANPDVDDFEPAEHYRVLSLDALVRVKLTAYRRKDQVHLLDMIGANLIDATWVVRLPEILGLRLQQLLDDPDG